MARTYTKRQTLRTYASIIVVTQLLFLIGLGLFQSIWVYGGSETAIMNQTGLQRLRADLIQSSVLTIAYRPINEHPQAISDLQNVLLPWEQAQTGLNKGSVALQLPNSIPEEIQQALIPAQSDFVAIDAAAHSILTAILAHPDSPVDPIQLQIILDHERQYRIEMSQVVTLWQQRIDSAFLHIFWIEIVLVALLTGLVVGKYFFVTRSMFRVMERTMP